MDSPIARLMSLLDSLVDELKEIQTKEADAKLAAKEIAEQMEQLKDEADGTTATLFTFLLQFLFSLIFPQLLFVGVLRCVFLQVSMFVCAGLSPRHYLYIMFAFGCLPNK